MARRLFRLLLRTGWRLRRGGRINPDAASFRTSHNCYLGCFYKPANIDWPDGQPTIWPFLFSAPLKRQGAPLIYFAIPSPKCLKQTKNECCGAPCVVGLAAKMGKCARSAKARARFPRSHPKRSKPVLRQIRERTLGRFQSAKRLRTLLRKRGERSRAMFPEPSCSDAILKIVLLAIARLQT
jgi:hypothetical protein